MISVRAAPFPRDRPLFRAFGLLQIDLYSAYGSPCTSCRRGHFTLPISFGGVVLAPRTFFWLWGFEWMGGLSSQCVSDAQFLIERVEKCCILIVASLEEYMSGSHEGVSSVVEATEKLFFSPRWSRRRPARKQRRVDGRPARLPAGHGEDLRELGRERLICIGPVSLPVSDQQRLMSRRMHISVSRRLHSPFVTGV